MNILIAEDQHIVQMVHEMAMAKWGFDYDMASNGGEAVEFAKSNAGRYDLCIMDVSMPVMDGIEATRAIRREAGYFPILGYSAENEMREKCLEAGMDDFMLKPCTADRMFEIIHDITVKPVAVKLKNEEIFIERIMPMNSDELKELRELKKQGLTKLKLLGLDQPFVVHKNIQNKISHDLIAEGRELSEFIDRSPDEPGRCHLYKANLYITKDLFLPEELEEAIRQENEVAMRFSEAADKPDT
jgi:CheY-like chemotaxis protein